MTAAYVRASIKHVATLMKSLKQIQLDSGTPLEQALAPFTRPISSPTAKARKMDQVFVKKAHNLCDTTS